ncbi:hypothetical protein FVEN_g5582 [Fusarium venenatum]|uniref:Uncharacterized protein n=1 Tax=Fusarium venenatum TaxID=56646 RepID=A0A2L2TBN5_9HYPO|nr:uncharacterized protein FVRRES_03990 [Fusarium venenatum]KAG8356523.1 hypothetical protein FVEN_g5582 [Fusarium venenatum]CEI67478.1 unnamed protein product [Fusarium venenatum]
MEDIPKWDFGQQPKGINPVPADFIPFFSTTGNTRVDADKISLSFDLAAPTSRTRGAAWDRVPTLSTANGKNRSIMKRVPICNERKQPSPFTILPQVNFVIPNTRESIAFDELLPRKVRRGSKYEPISSEAAYSGNAMSHAFMVSELMVATTNVANNFMYTSSCTSYEDRRAARNGICQITPFKRRADVHNNKPDVPIMLTPTGGNKLGFYYKVLPMIKRAYSRGMKEVDLATASMTALGSTLRRGRRNPRQPLAAFGGSDLSDIIDESEPESPTVVREPVLKFESRSPAKRIARLTNPFSKSTPRGNRLAQGFVKLVPGLSRGGFSTPVKSRSSPVPQTASPVHDYAVASLQYSPAASDDEDYASPSKEGSPEPAEDLSSLLSPGRTFRVPSEFDSSSINGDESTRGPPSTPNKSPVNHFRPIGPTPSRWNRDEPSTPFTPVPQTATAATPGETDSPIGLYALLPDTPKAPACTYETLSGTDSIDFGGASAFESSLSWMNTSAQATEQARSQIVNQSRRRRSEPLLIKSVLNQARRRSASPQKLRFKADDTFQDVISIASLFDIPTSLDDTDLAPVQTVDTPDAIVSDEITMEEPAPIEPIHDTNVAPVESAPESIQTESVENESTDDGAVSEILPIEAVHDTNASDATAVHDEITDGPEPIAVADHDNVAADVNDAEVDEQMEDSVPIATDNDNVDEIIDEPPINEQSIVQIDVRENPDIFGANPSSPPAPIQSLSRMANDACNGLANVVVTEEDGRLFVRFKLSAEHAHMFPASQGFEDNDLTFSPSALATTPKTKTISHQEDSDLTFSPSALASTPNTKSNTRPLASTLQSNSSPVPFATPELPPYYDNTLVFGSPPVATTPRPTSTQRVTRRQSAMIPLKRATTNALEAANRTPAETTEPNHTTPKFESSVFTNDDTTIVFPWPDVEDSPARSRPRTQAAAPVTEPATPKFATPAADNADETLAVSLADVEDSPIQSNTSTGIVPAEESPNRAFMRDFIRQTRQPTTTESGSPTTPAATRKPLGDRSPNRGTPLMAKRKHEDEDEEDDKPSPKKAKVEATPKGKAARMKSNLTIDMVDLPETQDTESSVPTPGDTANAQAVSPPRRSSRLRATGGPKSSLPTPIKLSRAGAGRASLTRKPRSEEQELDRKTRSNTKKNMGDAESPAEVLTRIKDQSEEDSDVGEGSAGGRRVGWKDPLEKIQGSSPKKKATRSKTGVTKPKATRAAKVAEGPKSQRVTRSRARGGA